MERNNNDHHPNQLQKVQQTKGHTIMVTIALLILSIILAMVICFRNVLNCANGFEAGVSFVTFVVLAIWVPTLVQVFNVLGAQTHG